MTTYRMKYRPASSFTLPRGLGWELVKAPTYLRVVRYDLPYDPALPFGEFKTDRPLTADEMRDYEIEVMP
jgi:hypothetical protein